ncbi:GNAT family N-acetyltransferase [Streptomyces anulatus]|uniref:GNAT family N-acetyltransferase n=1 Tax=Streptomyces anulatus TaxID=1892 RepID=UPI0033ED272B
MLTTDSPGRAAPGRDRLAREDDAEQIAGLQVAAWRTAYAGILPAAELHGLDTAALAGFWRGRIEAGSTAGAHVLVHDEGRRILGFSSFGPARDDDLGQRPDAEELYAFYARPECWGTGVGRSLMRSTRSVWAERGTRAGYLWVLERNTRGRDFYRKGGWRQDPTAAPSGSGPDALEIRYELTGIGAGGLLHSGRSATTPGGTPAPAAPGDTPRRRTR